MLVFIPLTLAERHLCRPSADRGQHPQSEQDVLEELTTREKDRRVGSYVMGARLVSCSLPGAGRLLGETDIYGKVGLTPIID